MLVGQPAVSGGVGGLAAGVLASATTEVGEALDWQPAAASSDVGGVIARDETIDRAVYWLNRGDTWYSQNQSDAISDGDGHSYRPDCSGFVSMAWHLAKKSGGWDLNTSDFHTTDLVTPVSLESLKAGDAVLGSEHIELFDKYVDASDHSQGIWTYAEHDYGRKTEHDTMGWSYLNANFAGIRYRNIVDRRQQAKNDVDGDGRSDLALYRAGNGQWNVKSVTAGQLAGSYPYGGDPSDVPVTGDFDGDGYTDVGVYRHASGQWNIKSLHRGVQIVASHPYGGDPSDVPVVGDFDGDGYTDIGVYRHANGQWNIKSVHRMVQLVASHPYGGDPSDVPVVGDFDGDGTDDIGVYRHASGQWNIKSVSRMVQLYGSHPYGGDPSDVPVVGDYDGDGYADIAVYRHASGQWNVKSLHRGVQILGSHPYGGDPSDTIPTT